jgi:hypothetical protein
MRYYGVTNVDIAGHFSYISVALGMWCLARQNRLGWAFRFIGEAGWVAIGLYMGMSSIWLWGILFMGIDFYGYKQWEKNSDQNPEC